MVTRAATTTWEGELFTGKGSVTLDSSHAAGPLDVTWAARAEDSNGMTSPEELIAAAHSSCFSMFLSNVLVKAGHPAETLTTNATVHFEKGDSGFSVTRVDLSVRGRVPGIDAAGFQEAAETAKAGCPVSRALAAIDITLDATLES